MKELPILLYRDFWDVPRIFLASGEQSLLLFDCEFDKDVEDFGDEYKVFLMPELSEAELSGSWHGLSGKALRFLGEIPITEVGFDQTRRKFIQGEAITELLRRGAL